MRNRPVLDVPDDALADLVRTGAAKGESWVAGYSAAGSGQFSDTERPEISFSILILARSIKNWLRDFWYRLLFGPSSTDRLAKELVGVSQRTSGFLAGLPSRSVLPSWDLANAAFLANAALNSALRLNDLSSRSLSRAVSTYRDVTAGSMRERAPIEWAEVLSKLATALWRVGERDNDHEALEQAVQIFYEVLPTQTRNNTPLRWAATQQSLANALTVLGERAGDERRFREAEQAFRGALTVLTRDNEPLQWATTQLGLARILSWLSHSDVERGDGAILAYREALTVVTRERAPLDWAVIQNNLGVHLMSHASRGGRFELFFQAIESFQLALEEMPTDATPFNAAITTTNLGMALIQTASSDDGRSELEQGVKLLRKSVSLFREADSAQGVESASQILAYAEALLAIKK